MPQTVWVSWSSRQADFSSSSSCSHISSSSRSWGQDAEVRASSRQRDRALRTPFEQPIRMRKKCCYSQRNLGSICCRLSSSPTYLSRITNINPFVTLSRINCEKCIFLKKCVRSSLLLIMFPHVYAYRCIMAIQQIHEIDR